MKIKQIVLVIVLLMSSTLLNAQKNKGFEIETGPGLDKAKE